MSATSIRAKLSGVRALSTVLLGLALARPAEAQVFGAPARHAGASWWFGADGGSTSAVSVSDRASGATWGLEKAAPIRVSLDYGPRERTIGIAVSQSTVQLSFAGPSCTACLGQVTAQQAMAHYRIAAPLFIPGLYSVTEFSAGVTRWSELQGREGSQVGAIAPNNDFTYGLSLGAALPLGARLELTAAYDASHVRHEAQRSAPAGASVITSVKMSTVRVGARVRVGH